MPAAIPAPVMAAPVAQSVAEPAAINYQSQPQPFQQSPQQQPQQQFQQPQQPQPQYQQPQQPSNTPPIIAQHASQVGTQPSNVQPISNGMPPKKEGGRRLSASIMNDVDALIEDDSNSAKAKKELTEADAHSTYNSFVEALRTGNRLSIYGQFIKIQMRFAAPDELKLVSPDTFTEAYAANHRNELIEFFGKEIGIHIRVTTHVEVDPNTVVQQEKVLSKGEVYEEMARENPYLAQLKDGLNLQIEY